ncbi:hypothetical protein JKP88DRAFT_347261 [Tribonema minus]|uniref:RNA polymerase II subunit B1 CTD phosphatase RPAP2 homolog n=1 Tax=Tribonema minus TaxID=303371 RepID=A0A835YJQ0_9STRA|nr:hypothetical protein JKP88DRAFT_347261 [Tribonema minus]
MQDVVEERSLAGLCGWPLCRGPAEWAVKGKSRYRISLRAHEIYERVDSSKIYERVDSSKFCSVNCQAITAALAASFPTDSPYTRAVALAHVADVQTSSGDAPGAAPAKTTAAKRARRRDSQAPHAADIRQKLEALSLADGGGALSAAAAADAGAAAAAAAAGTGDGGRGGAGAAVAIAAEAAAAAADVSRGDAAAASDAAASAAAAAAAMDTEGDTSAAASVSDAAVEVTAAQHRDGGAMEGITEQLQAVEISQGAEGAGEGGKAGAQAAPQAGEGKHVGGGSRGRPTAAQRKAKGALPPRPHRVADAVMKRAVARCRRGRSVPLTPRTAAAAAARALPPRPHRVADAVVKRALVERALPPRPHRVADTVMKRAVVERAPAAAQPMPLLQPAFRGLVEGHAPSPAFEATVSFSVAPREAPLGASTPPMASTKGPPEEGEGLEEGSTSGEAEEGDSDAPPQGDADDWDEEGEEGGGGSDADGPGGPWLDLDALHDKRAREEFRASLSSFITLWGALAEWVTPETRACLLRLRGDPAATSTSSALFSAEGQDAAVPLQRAPHAAAATLDGRHRAVSAQVHKHARATLLAQQGPFLLGWSARCSSGGSSGGGSAAGSGSGGGAVGIGGGIGGGGGRGSSVAAAREVLAALLASFDYTCATPQLAREQWALLPLVLGGALLGGGRRERGSAAAQVSAVASAAEALEAAAETLGALEAAAEALGVTRSEYRLLCGVLEADACQL